MFSNPITFLQPKHGLTSFAHLSPLKNDWLTFFCIPAFQKLAFAYHCVLFRFLSTYNHHTTFKTHIQKPLVHTNCYCYLSCMATHNTNR